MLIIAAILALAVVAVGVWLARREATQRWALAALLRAQEDDAAARRRAIARAAWMEAALETHPDGVLVADAALRVVHWNARFAALAGLPEDLSREGATLESLLRLSAEAGEFGLVDVDQEVAGQLALVARGPAAFPQLRHRPDGGIVEFHLAELPGGGILMRCIDVTARTTPAAPAPAATAPPAPRPSFPPRARRSLVLLVEDMKVNQVVTATQLRRDGHRVDVADSGAAALRMAAATPYDLVLMDIMMPGMSGYDAARGLRALPGPAGQAPIFALTANMGEEERERCLAAGMQGMLTKPVPPAVMREVLKGAAPSATAAPVDPDLLDPARLGELRRELPAATLVNLCRQCLDDMAERLASLASALSGGDADAIAHEAHALAGMAGSYALGRMERQARAVLAAASCRDLAAARAAARGIDDTFARSRAALLAWLTGVP
jgi:CheY-like chemotaxis protein/HPt (histidine-containing phosphotransfer) domain-containing protein